MKLVAIEIRMKHGLYVYGERDTLDPKEIQQSRKKQETHNKEQTFRFNLRDVNSNSSARENLSLFLQAHLER